MWSTFSTLVLGYASVSLTVAFVVGRWLFQKESAKTKEEKPMTTLQLLIALEEHGVADIFILDGTITMLNCGDGPLMLPLWLLQEYERHMPTLRKQLRRQHSIPIFLIGVYT
jgi:hypothetical protein